MSPIYLSHSVYYIYIICFPLSPDTCRLAGSMLKCRETDCQFYLKNQTFGIREKHIHIYIFYTHYNNFNMTYIQYILHRDIIVWLYLTKWHCIIVLVYENYIHKYVGHGEPYIVWQFTLTLFSPTNISTWFTWNDFVCTLKD